MSLTDTEVLARCDEMRRFVVEDLERIVAQPVGGNFAVAGLVAVGCEVLASLQGRRGDGGFVLADMLPAKFAPVAHSIWSAMRNGLLHHYWPKRIHIGTAHVDLAVAWRDGPIVIWENFDGAAAALRFSAPALVRGLDAAWARFLEVLPGCRQALADARADLEKPHRVDRVHQDPELSHWVRLLSDTETLWVAGHGPNPKTGLA